MFFAKNADRSLTKMSFIMSVDAPQFKHQRLTQTQTSIVNRNSVPIHRIIAAPSVKKPQRDFTIDSHWLSSASKSHWNEALLLSSSSVFNSQQTRAFRGSTELYLLSFPVSLKARKALKYNF